MTEDETDDHLRRDLRCHAATGRGRQARAGRASAARSVSTLRDYENLGNNYWAAAEPHLQVTPAIQTMADEITAGIEDRREQAKAITDWVKRNIRYLIVHQGVGRDLSIEPAETILRNRAGECKEHAVLTKALLAAKGVESELVLHHSARSP